jgi:hypothetical protein
VVFAAALGCALAPLAVALVRTLFFRSQFVPFADRATIELATRAVGRHAVLLGPYSRFGFRQPGPSLFYLLALPYRLTGSRASSILVGAVLINAAAVVGIGFVARRRGGTVLAVVTLGITLLLMRTLTGTSLDDPWNPLVTLLPFALFVLLAWSVALGDGWMLPIALGVGSFVVQSHVSYAPATVGVLVVAFVGLVLAWRRRSPEEVRARPARVLAVSAGVVGLVWLPPLIDQLARVGNLGGIWNFFTSHTGTLTWLQSVRVVALQWSWRPEWLFGARPLGLIGVNYVRGMDWPVALVLGAVVTVFAWRRRDREVLWLAAMVAVGFVGAIIGAHGIVGLVYPYLVQWTWILGATLGILVVWGGIRAIPPAAIGRVARVSAGSLVAVVFLVLVIAGIGSAVRAQVPDANAQQRVRSVRDQVLSHVDVRGRTVRVDGGAIDFDLWSLVLQLQRRGAHVQVSAPTGFFVGDWLHSRAPRIDTTLVVGHAPPFPPGRLIAHEVEPYPARVRAQTRRDVERARRKYGPTSPITRAFEDRLRFITTTPAAEVSVVER